MNDLTESMINAHIQRTQNVSVPHRCAKLMKPGNARRNQLVVRIKELVERVDQCADHCSYPILKRNVGMFLALVEISFETTPTKGMIAALEEKIYKIERSVSY